MVNKKPAGEGSWLSNTLVREIFSQQLRMIGRSLTNEVRSKRFPLSFARLLNQALRAPGKLLSSQVMQGDLLSERDLRLWATLALLAAIAPSGAQATPLPDLPPSLWRRARAAAAAAEFLGVALDVIDDIQDGDSPFVQHIGVPIALNIGLALLELASLTLGKARKAGWPDPIADKALEVLHSEVLTSLGGQFLDLRFERERSVTEAQIIEMTQKKSGTLLALVCRIGAMAGMAADQERPADYFETASLFGWYLGMWSQLLNDLHDAEVAQTQREKSDRQRGKKTLPLVLEERGILENILEPAEQWSPHTQTAFSYTYVSAEIFRLRAQKTLRALEERFGPHPLLWPLTEHHPTTNVL